MHPIICKQTKHHILDETKYNETSGFCQFIVAAKN